MFTHEQPSFVNNTNQFASHWWKNRLPSSPISREAVGTATNGTFSRGSGGEPRPKAWAQGARWPAGAREGL